MILNLVLGFLALLSAALLLWQWAAARRFPIHRRSGRNLPESGVTLLKPLKGCDASTAQCLRSWFTQEFSHPVQMLFGVASADDPVCAIVEELQKEFPHQDSKLVRVDAIRGANAKVSKLAELARLARHDILVVSDADVCVPRDFLSEAVAPLSDSGVGLVNCFYALANPQTLAMRWEAVAINADFWSQVLQSKTLKPLDFALGAVMVTRRAELDAIGGFEALQECLADDYQLGNRIARIGRRIELCPVVVECWDPPMSWSAVWKHQLRWARTIRVCQPAPYFFSILSNPTLWPLLWAAAAPSTLSLAAFTGCLLLRLAASADLQHRLTRSLRSAAWAWLAPVKDILQLGIWFFAFTGNSVEWRGQRFRLRPDGTLEKAST